MLESTMFHTWVLMFVVLHGSYVCLLMFVCFFESICYLTILVSRPYVRL